MKIKAIAIVALGLFSASSMAESHVSGPDGQWIFGGSITKFSLDSEAAHEQGISNSAWTLSIDANYVQSDWLTTISLDMLSYSDHNDFDQQVVGDGWSNSGQNSTQSSEAVGIMTSFAFGKMWRMGQDNKLVLSAQGGFSAMISSERSIANCDDCYSEDIDIGGGAFVRAGIVNNFERFALGFRVTQYLTGDDLKNNAGVTLSMAF